MSESRKVTLARPWRHMKSSPPPFRIETPCPKRWETMRGDSKRRFCDHCQLHVHNLSAMSEKDHEHFIATCGGHACIVYEVRSDGSMVTPSRWSWLLLPFQRLRWSVAAVLAAFLPFLFSSCATRRTMGTLVHTCDAPSQHANSGKEFVLPGRAPIPSTPKLHE